MNFKSISFTVALLVGFARLFGQQTETAMISADDAILKGLNRVVLPAGYSTKPLPAKRDNSRTIYFSGIYNQYVWNCNQASSIWTMFTYEINYLRNLNSTLPENQYSPMAIYNLLNYGNGNNGVSYFDSWELIKENGIPGNADFEATGQNAQIWMTGYEKYYRGMKNRIEEVSAIDIGSPEGLLTLKHWINDHLNGSSAGGVANFQIGSGDMVIPQIPMDKGLEEEGQYIVIKYGPYVGHAMTFVGWNDSVRYDVNQDGKYTNNIDIDGDGQVTMKDWEVGAMLVVNSWGSYYNAGKLWVMYRLLAETPADGGIWNNAAMVVKPKVTYEPMLTVKAAIRYNQRNRLKIQVGLATNPNATTPERTMDYTCFNFQGDTLPMQGFKGVDSDLLEIGLDITPLINYIPENGEAKIFLEVIQKSPNSKGSGSIESFSVIDYANHRTEFVNTDGVVPIQRNAITRLSVPINSQVTRPTIVTSELPAALVGKSYHAQMVAFGTTGPYRYPDPSTRYEESTNAASFNFDGGANVFSEPGITARVMDIPFFFPFYKENFNQLTILSDGGIVMGPNLVKYPYVIDPRLQMYQNKGIFPFFGVLYYPDDSYRVTLETSATEATVRWHASADPQGLQPLEFAAKILSDGKIFFYYGDVSTTPDLAWISGVSAGNNLDYHLMDHNSTGLTGGTSFGLQKITWPSWLTLTSDGEFKGTPDRSGTYTLPVIVNDWAGISTRKNLVLTVIGGSIVEGDDLAGDFQVFPNPATDRIWFKGHAENAGSLSLSLFDVVGNQVFLRQYEVPAGKILISVDEIKTLPSGVYFYQVKGMLSGSGKLIRQ